MNQVIVKSKVENRDRLEAILEAKNLEFSPIYWQHDRVYVPRGYKPQTNLPRLIMRTEMHAVDEPPKYTLILRRHIEDSGLDFTESTPVTDYASAARIILQLGFIQLGEVSRRRETIALNDTTTLHLDTLDTPTAGNETTPAYLKLEQTLAPDSSAPAAKQSLIALLTTLGEPNLIEKPYAEL